VRPDVLDDKNWSDGFEGGFLDKGKQYDYAITRSRSQSLWIDTNQVKEGEIKWKDQDALLSTDARQLTEQTVRGTYPTSIAPTTCSTTPTRHPIRVPERGRDYITIDAEPLIDEILKTQRVAKEILG
jgi:hypothetical protein